MAKQKKVCINCRNGAIGISPSVGGFTSGVYCHSKEMARHLDKVTNGLDYRREFAKYNFLHLFRLECIELGIECPCFEDRINVDKGC